uniref:Uncharacterized protein n=1 Tax=Rhodnius prolixus TaxID=13249 RepID=T1I4U1_RHOPR
MAGVALFVKFLEFIAIITMNYWAKVITRAHNIQHMSLDAIATFEEDPGVSSVPVSGDNATFPQETYFQQFSRSLSYPVRYPTMECAESTASQAGAMKKWIMYDNRKRSSQWLDKDEPPEEADGHCLLVWLRCHPPQLYGTWPIDHGACLLLSTRRNDEKSCD